MTDNAGNVVRVYKFILDRRPGVLITALDNDTDLIDIERLRTTFESAIAAFDVQLRADPTHQTNFSNMFPKHPGIRIG